MPMMEPWQSCGTECKNCPDCGAFWEDDQTVCHVQTSDSTAEGATEFKEAELEDNIAEATSPIDQSASESARLKAEVRQLEAGLAALCNPHRNSGRIRAGQR